MSHRWSCPNEWEARREGERAYEYGRSRSSNPYEDTYWNRDRACPEAAEDWSRGYRRAEIQAEEAREEEAARHRATRRRAEEQAEWDDYAQAQEYYAIQDEREWPSDDDFILDHCASTGHARHDEAGDRFGPRCYCGMVRWAL